MGAVRWLAVGLMGCAGGGTDAGGGDSGPPPTASDDTGPPAVSSPALDVRVVDVRRDPVDNASVTILHEATEQFQRTNADGEAGWPSLEAGVHLVVVSPPKDLSTYLMTMAVLLDVDRGREVDLALADLPKEPARLGDTPREVGVGGGVFVTASKSEITPAGFRVETSRMQAAYLAPVVRPPFEPSDGQAVQGVWTLWPYDYQAPKGLPIAFQNRWDLRNGDTYGVYQLIPEDYAWERIGEVTVSGDRLEGDAMLTRLTTVVLASEG